MKRTEEEEEEAEDSRWRLLKGERRDLCSSFISSSFLRVCQRTRLSEPVKDFNFENLYSVGLMRLSFLKALKISTKPQDLTSEVKHKRSEKVESRVPPVNSSQSTVHYG